MQLVINQGTWLDRVKFWIKTRFNPYEHDSRLDDLLNFLFENLNTIDVSYKIGHIVFQRGHETWEFYVSENVQAISSSVIHKCSNNDDENQIIEIVDEHVPSWYNQYRLYLLYNQVRDFQINQRYLENTAWLDQYKNKDPLVVVNI